MFWPGPNGKEQVIKFHCPGMLSPAVGIVTLAVASDSHGGDKAGKSLPSCHAGKGT